jgi:hypothetical protein
MRKNNYSYPLENGLEECDCCAINSKKIAATLNINTQAYGNMERGKSDICISRLIELQNISRNPGKNFSEDQYTAIIRFDHTELFGQRILDKKIG